MPTTSRTRHHRVTLYTRHGRRGCTARHRTALTTARCVWPNALWINQRGDGGPWASVSYCRHPSARGDQTSVVLHPTEQGARDALWFIDEYGCGGGCTRRHRLVRIAVAGTPTSQWADDPTPDDEHDEHDEHDQPDQPEEGRA